MFIYTCILSEFLMVNSNFSWEPCSYLVLPSLRTRLDVIKDQRFYWREILLLILIVYTVKVKTNRVLFMQHVLGNADWPVALFVIGVVPRRFHRCVLMVIALRSLWRAPIQTQPLGGSATDGSETLVEEWYWWREFVVGLWRTDTQLSLTVEIL